MPLYVLFILLGGLFTAPSLLLETSRLANSGVLDMLERDDSPEDGEVIEVSILALKNARYRQGRPLPRWIQKPHGKRVRIWGFMAIGTLEGLENFELVPESCECGRSRVNHFVDVSLTEGHTRFIPGRITLQGTFYASEQETDGFVTSLYRLSTPSLPR